MYTAQGCYAPSYKGDTNFRVILYIHINKTTLYPLHNLGHNSSEPESHIDAFSHKEEKNSLKFRKPLTDVTLLTIKSRASPVEHSVPHSWILGTKLEEGILNRAFDLTNFIQVNWFRYLFYSWIF